MTEILPGVHQVDGVNANSYFMLQDDGSLTLIDTGMSSDAKKILNYLSTNLSRKLSDVKTIVLTHAHVDHARGAYSIKKATGAKLAVHEADSEYVSGNQKLPSPKGAIGFLFEIISPFFKSKPVDVDQRLKDNDTIGRLTVLHTPGHTPGSISLYDRERRLVFVGDTIRYMKGKLEGPPRQFTTDMKEAIKSVEKISNLEFDTMLSGHGEVFKSNDAPRRVKALYASLGVKNK